METKFNFKSQIATSRSQSERLLSLGLKKETADMHHSYYTRVSFDGSKSHFWKEETGYSEKAIPAWSLHRLIEMIAYHVDIYGNNVIVMDEYFNDKDNLYGNVIDCIEWLIKLGYFNKEYLV